MNPQRRADFTKMYGHSLALAITANPRHFTYGLDRVPHIADLMVSMLYLRKASKHSRVLKATLSALSIKPTYKAIRAYLDGEGTHVLLTFAALPRGEASEEEEGGQGSTVSR